MSQDQQPASDFRSDTVTRPCAAMRQAMAEAPVGDDVFGDDPSVNALEAEAAELFGVEAALFTPSGTQANLIAMTCHARPGEEIFLEDYAHTYNNEVGGVARFAGVVTRTFSSQRGCFDLGALRHYARRGDLHQPRTALLCVENTHNFHGGAVVPLEHLHELRTFCDEADVRLHIDGARLLNASVASGTPPAAYGEVADSIMCCLSKGLGAPVGSVLLGSKELIEEGRRVRKTLGGGMRQAGVLAAPALLALRDGPARLSADHALAQDLAQGMSTISGAVIDPDAVETNILFLRTELGEESYPEIAAGLQARGVLAIAVGALGVRFVTHRDVGPADGERALDALTELLPSLGMPDTIEV